MKLLVFRALPVKFDSAAPPSLNKCAVSETQTNPMARDVLDDWCFSLIV